MISKEQRLYQVSIPIIGLTGGIGTGKSTVGKILKENGFHVINADQLIHEIYTERKVKDFLKMNTPNCIENNVVDFKKLRKVFFDKEHIKTDLTALLYSYLEEYFKRSIPNNASFIIYDVPLLFEKQMEQKFDLVVTVASSLENQKLRLKIRDPEMTKETRDEIIRNQFDMEFKKKHSDFVINNDNDLEALKKETLSLFKKIKLQGFL